MIRQIIKKIRGNTKKSNAIDLQEECKTTAASNTDFQINIESYSGRMYLK